MFAASRFKLPTDLLSPGSQLAVTPDLKAAAQYMKAYTAARQYRNIPIGYFAEVMEPSLGSLVEYLACGDNSSEAIDFYAIKDSSFSLCAERISSSEYSLLASHLQNVSIPIIYSQDGCFMDKSLDFAEQQIIFGSNLSNIISGTIVDNWREQDGEEGYGLVNYTATGAASTPTTLKDYVNLQSQWDEVTWNTDPPSTITPTIMPFFKQWNLARQCRCHIANDCRSRFRDHRQCSYQCRCDWH
ncbi:CAZyme family GH72 [Penicillium angulare]|uniref:CAZyme family GH72 n=1 Tax=Penicillium angulare TaxID=116970 RepID=UPI00253FE79D|nr:CAZyme family GH72 [Penicillium angulare]KAJ5290844.1 CAZyme family GH72 [Penicillium angulare]